MNLKTLLGAAAFGALIATLSLTPQTAEAKKKIKIKHGTLAPKGSPWDKALRRMGRRWKEASDGQIRFKIYAGAVAGDEADMLRKMRIGQLQSATLTSIGLSRLTKSIMAWQMPMLMNSYAELDYVREKMGAEMEAELEKTGFIVLHWGDAGWVQFFSKNKDLSPAALKQQPMYMWSGDPDADAVVKSAGLKTVPLSNTEVMSALQTGMVTWYPTTPLYALSSQWFGLTKHMLTINWAPLNGATVISKKAWDKIDPALQEKLLKIAREEGFKIQKEIRSLDKKAVKAMVDRGLVVEKPTPAQLATWKKMAAQTYVGFRGKIVPAAMFDEVQRLAAEYRKAHP